MKKFSIFLLALSLFAACTNDTTEDLSLFIPGALKISFDSQSRVELDQNCQTVWTKGDKVGVFYDNYYPTLYEYEGETGAKEGILVPKEQVPDTSEEVVVVYPYNELNYHDTFAKQIWEVIIPTTQYYRAGSYGVGANIMVGVGTSENIELKSICGWIKLQFTGSEKLTKITLRGNNNEHIAGEIAVNYRDLTSEFANEWDAETKITLDLGEGVQLSETPTDFYISLLPQTFTNGITVTAIAENGTQIHQTTDKQITICRNVIQPMKSVQYSTLSEINPADIPDNEIWYTTTDGNIIKPKFSEINIISNKYENGKGIIRFDCDILTKIPSKSFCCSNLESIVIPDSVTAIEYCAFSLSTDLTSVTIPDSVISIGDSAFADCINLSSVTIPDSVISIGYGAFSGCYGLTSVTIGNGVTTIGDYAFSNCDSLTSITIPDSVTSIGDAAFSGCKLTAFYGKYASADNRCLIVDGVLNSFAPAGISSYTILDGVTEIGNCAFSGCDSLASVTIPDSVITIGWSAFFGCSSLISMTIPDSVTSIGETAFHECSNLIDVTIGNSVTTIGVRAFSDCYKLESISIGNSVTAIQYNAFDICISLTSVHISDLSAWCRINFDINSVYANPLRYAGNLYLNGKLVTELTIPSDITKIKDNVFGGCSSLTSVTIHNGVFTIGEDAFANCSNLETVAIGNSVTSIGNYAFYDCYRLQSIIIPDSVTFIGKSAFGINTIFHSSSMTSIYCKPTIPPTVGGKGVFGPNTTDRKIYVPIDSVDAYKAADGWKEYADAIESYDF